MDGSFVAKFGGKPCLRCKQQVVAGQRVRFSGYTKDLVHTPICPPKPVARVFFRHSCGCPVGDCVHGSDEELTRIAAERAVQKARRRA